MPNDERGPQIPENVRKAFLGAEYGIVEKSFLPLNPDAPLSEANNFEELCHELEVTIRGLEGEIFLLKKDHEEMSATLMKMEGIIGECEIERDRLEEIVADMSEFLTDEGCDPTVEGLNDMRERVAGALGDDICPDWLIKYRTLK